MSCCCFVELVSQNSHEIPPLLVLSCAFVGTLLARAPSRTREPAPVSAALAEDSCLVSACDRPRCLRCLQAGWWLFSLETFDASKRTAMTPSAAKSVHLQLLTPYDSLTSNRTKNYLGNCLGLHSRFANSLARRVGTILP